MKSDWKERDTLTLAEKKKNIKNHKNKIRIDIVKSLEEKKNL